MRRYDPPSAALGIALVVGALALAGVAGAQATTLFDDGDELSLEAGEGQAIRGQTSLDPGSTVTVTVESENPQSPFLVRPQADVGEDGRFTTYVDLSNVDPGSNVTAEVSHDGEALAETTVRVGECDGGCKPMATIDQGDDQFTLRAGPGQEITGTTSLDSASSVTVRLESVDAVQPFLVTTETLVSDGGSFSTHLDLTDVRAGTRVRASIHHDGKRLTETSGEVVACDGDCEPAATETPTPRPTIEADELGFRSVVEVAETGTARIPVALGDADEATLRIGSDGVNYVTAATVRDGNGDGRVVVEFDAGAAGTDDRTLSVADEADELAVIDPEPELGFSIEPADYEMQLYEGGSTEGDPHRVGTLVVRQADPTQREKPTLEKNVLRTQPGESVDIPIGVGDGGSATIAIGGDETVYGVNATVRDGDGDGRVVLLFATDHAGTDRPTLEAASAADNVTITDPEPSLDGPLPETHYDVSLYGGTDTADGPVDVGTLSVGTDEELEATRTAALADSRPANEGIDLGGVGALAAGAVFAVVGVGLLLGLFRS